MKTYAYARVSARDQNLQRQITAFMEFGVKKSRIFSDKMSGKDFERFGYQKLLQRIKQGDLLVIKSIDRLGRNYDAIIHEWDRLTNKIGADILVLDMPLLDTREQNGSLVGKLISDIVLQVLSFVAENERENIKARQADGIKLALEKGVKFGRPTVEYSEKFLSVVDDYFHKKISSRDVMRMFGIKKYNFYYHIRRIRYLKIAVPLDGDLLIQ